MGTLVIYVAEITADILLYPGPANVDLSKGFRYLLTYDPGNLLRDQIKWITSMRVPVGSNSLWQKAKVNFDNMEIYASLPDPNCKTLFGEGCITLYYLGED